MFHEAVRDVDSFSMVLDKVIMVCSCIEKKRFWCDKGLGCKPGVVNLWRIGHSKVAHCIFLMTSHFYSLIFFFICPPPIFFSGKQNI